MTRQIQPINTILRPDGTIDVPPQPTCGRTIAANSSALNGVLTLVPFDTTIFESEPMAGVGSIGAPLRGVYLISAMCVGHVISPGAGAYFNTLFLQTFSTSGGWLTRATAQDGNPTSVPAGIITPICVPFNMALLFDPNSTTLPTAIRILYQATNTSSNSLFAGQTTMSLTRLTPLE